MSIYDIFHHRHSWRNIKMTELSELYIAMTIKTLGTSLVGIFVPVYLYQIGYSIQTISLYYAAIYGIRVLTDYISGRLVGWFGPKHIMIVGQVFQLSYFALLLTLPQYSWSLLILAVVRALDMGTYYIPYHVEFSKLQHNSSSGKEIGTMFQMAKIASAAGPLIGGFVASFYDIKYVIAAAMVLILAGSIPLLMSPEPVKRHQKVTFKKFPWPKTTKDLMTSFFLSIDQMVILFMWPLYISAFIFTENVYLSIGLVTSMGLVVSFVVAHIYGKLIDRKKGGLLMKYGTIGQSVSHSLRALITSATGVYMFNFVGDPTSVALRMPYTRGFYYAASSHEGYRIAYIIAMNTASNIARSLFWFVLFMLSTSTNNDQLSLRIAFLIAGLSVLVVLKHDFKALK